MFSKVLVVAIAVASALAGPIEHHHGATSYTSFNQDHNSVHHVDSAPALIKAAPVYSAAPAYKAAPAYSAPSYSAHSYSAPAYTQAYATPVAKVAVPVFKVAPVAKYAAPIGHYSHAPSHYDHEEKHSPAQYKFSYAVQDPHTGDYHSQEEHRDGHHVVGQYSLHEADGTVRVVKYSDDGHGLQAVVEKHGEPTSAPSKYKKVVVPVAAPEYHHNHY